MPQAPGSKRAAMMELFVYRSLFSPARQGQLGVLGRTASPWPCRRRHRCRSPRPPQPGRAAHVVLRQAEAGQASGAAAAPDAHGGRARSEVQEGVSAGIDGLRRGALTKPVVTSPAAPGVSAKMLLKVSIWMAGSSLKEALSSSARSALFSSTKRVLIRPVASVRESLPLMGLTRGVWTFALNKPSTPVVAGGREVMSAGTPPPSSAVTLVSMAWMAAKLLSAVVCVLIRAKAASAWAWLYDFALAQQSQFSSSVVPLKSSAMLSGALGSRALIWRGVTVSRTSDVKLALALLITYLPSDSLLL